MSNDAPQSTTNPNEPGGAPNDCVLSVVVGIAIGFFVGIQYACNRTPPRTDLLVLVERRAMVANLNLSESGGLDNGQSYSAEQDRVARYQQLGLKLEIFNTLLT